MHDLKILRDVPVYFAWKKKKDWEYFFAKSICLGARMNECVGYCKVFLLFQVRVDCEIIVSHWITQFLLRTNNYFRKGPTQRKHIMIFYVALRSIIVVIIVQ